MARPEHLDSLWRSLLALLALAAFGSSRWGGWPVRERAGRLAVQPKKTRRAGTVVPVDSRRRAGDNRRPVSSPQALARPNAARRRAWAAGP